LSEIENTPYQRLKALQNEIGLSRDAVVNAVEPHILIEVEASASWRVEPSRKPDSALSRL
jgi:hypothetical protein